MLERRKRPGWAEKLAFEILPGPGLHTSDEAKAFWWESVGVTDTKQLQSAEFLSGFVLGALSIYQQVKSAL